MSEIKVIPANIDGPDGEGLQPMPQDHEAPYTITSENSVERAYQYFSDETDQLHAGAFETTPSTSRIDGFPITEVAVIIEGQMIIHSKSGDEEIFNPGECYILPKGFFGTVEFPIPTKKFYIILNA